MSRISLFAILVLFLCCAAAIAQTGTIQGVMLDPSGGAIPNAKITATDEEKAIVVRETVSATDGTFFLRNLLPGRYTVKSEIRFRRVRTA